MSDDAPAARPPLTFGTQFSYSIGSIAYGLKGAALGVVLLLYYQIYGLPAIWVSGGIGLALIIDAIAHPLVGQISDMWRSKWGRRHPFMYASAIPVTIAVWALLNPPHGWSDQNLFIYMMSCLLVARVALAMFEIPNSSLLPEMVPNYNERTRILSYRYFMGVFVPLVVTVVGLRVIFQPFVNERGEAMPGQLNPAGYPVYGLVLAVIIFASIMISAFGTHSEVKYMRPPAKTTSLADLVKVVGTTLFNRNFLALTMSGIVFSIGTGIISSISPLLNTFFWELSAKQLSVLTGFTIIAPIAATIFAPMLSKWLGKKRAVLTNFYAAVLIGVIPISLRLLGVLPPNGHPIIMPILVIDGVMSATLGIMGFIIVSSMMADIVEQLQVKTGKRSEGLLFSADAFLKQVVSGFGAMGSGLVLAAVAFPAKAAPGHVAPEVLTNMALIYLPISAVTSLISISIISFYTISREDHEKNLDTIGDAAATRESAIEKGELDLAGKPVPIGQTGL